MKRFLIWAAVGLAVILSLAVAGLAWLGYSLEKSLEPKFDPSLYTQVVRDRAKASPKYAFLPSAINAAAQDVAFYHVPGFMQGGDIVCLRIRLPEKRVFQIMSELETSGRPEVHDFGDLPKPHCYPAFGLSKSTHKKQLAVVTELPANFRIFLFQSNLENIKTNWNHSFLAFTAVSSERNEVVYYADNW